MKKKIAIMRSFGSLVAVVIFMIVMPVSICASADLVLTRADYNMSIAVEDTCHIGRYTAATYDGTMLLDDYPNAGSSYTTIRIDGYDYYQDSIMDPYVLQKPTKSGDSIVTKWVLAPYVTVSQNITLMQNTMQYQLVVANIGYASHRVNVRTLFDVALGDSDAVLCWVPVAGEITTEREFKDLDYWRTKSSLDRSSLTSNCTFDPDNKPEKVQFASWEDIYNNSLDYTISEGLDITSDTAVAMYWDLGTLASGESKVVTVYYGIESRPIIPPKLEITGLFTEFDNYIPTQSVKLHANVDNDGDAPLTNGQLAITILNPNGEKVFGNVSTIAINPKQTISSCFTYYVPVNALNGVYTINATIYNAEMILLDQREATFSVNPINISISDLFPPDDVMLRSNDVLFSWTTNENSTTEVHIKPETESGYIKIIGESGLDHEVIVANLTRGINYTWYAKSSTPSGSGISDNRTLYIDNVIVFTDDEYAFTVDRDYNQRVNVSVKNTDSKPHEVLVTANSDYEDIFVGFAVAGSGDRILSLNPGETRNVTLVINAHASELEEYTFTVSLTNLDAGNIIDYALIHLTVIKRGANVIYVPDDYQIMAGAKLIEKVQTNAIVNLNGVIYDFDATLQGDYAVWVEELDDYIYKGDTYHGIAGYNKSPIIVKIAVSKDGLFLLGTFDGTADDNLVIFAQNRGLTNYRDFRGNLLDKSQYGVPHDVFLDFDARQNMLAYRFGELYKHLYNKGCIWSGPKDYNELYNCDYTLENRFDLPISVIRLYLLHDQRVDLWNEKYRPIREARNAKWSPSGNKPNPNYLLSRNFNVDYQNVNGSFVWMQTHTDNLQSDVTIYRMDKPPDYSCRGGGDSRSWQVKYDLYAESYTVHNVGCAVAELFLCDQPPNRVQMGAYTPRLQFLPAEKITAHGNIKQSVTIAVLGDITTSNSLKYICNTS